MTDFASMRAEFFFKCKPLLESDPFAFEGKMSLKKSFSFVKIAGKFLLAI